MRGRGGVKGQRGGKGEQSILYTRFRVPTTSVGARGEGQKGVKGSEGEQSILYARF